MAANPGTIREKVMARLLAEQEGMTAPDAPSEPTSKKLGVCRERGCESDADGLQGFCRSCARQRQLDGRWATIPLDQQD